MRKILRGLGLLAGAAAVVAGGKMIYDHYNDDHVEDVVETTEEAVEVTEEVTPVVDEAEDIVEDETTV